jgi:hypothetical protein
MVPEKQPQVIGNVRSQDLSVSWISESGTNDENTDRVCILMMANGQVRLTMQTATLNMKGMRLTKGHICVFELFEPYCGGNPAAADKASEAFMNNVMKHDITKKPAKDVISKCLAIADKTVKKEFGDVRYRASVAAFAAKDLTACCVNGGRMFILQDDGSILRFTSDSIGTLCLGTAWKNVMLASEGYPVADDEIKEDMHSPIGDMITKRGMRSLPCSSSLIRAQRL